MLPCTLSFCEINGQMPQIWHSGYCICRITLNHDFVTFQKCKTLLALHYEEWEHILWSDETKTERGERKKKLISDELQDVLLEPGQSCHCEHIVLTLKRWECDDMVLRECKGC